MTSEWTPTTEQMRYRASLVCHQGGCSIEDQERGAEFDRFIAQLQADALRSAADTLDTLTTTTLNGDAEEWVRVRDLHARADLIEEQGEL